MWNHRTAVLMVALAMSSITVWGQIGSFTNVGSLGPGGGGGVLAAVFHNQDPNLILLGQDIGGIDKTTDGGDT